MSQDEIDIRLVESYESTWNLGASLSQIPILGTYGELHTSIFCYLWDAAKVIVAIRSRDWSAGCFCFSPRLILLCTANLTDEQRTLVLVAFETLTIARISCP